MRSKIDRIVFWARLNQVNLNYILDAQIMAQVSGTQIYGAAEFVNVCKGLVIAIEPHLKRVNTHHLLKKIGQVYRL